MPEAKIAQRPRRAKHRTTAARSSVRTGEPNAPSAELAAELQALSTSINHASAMMESASATFLDLLASRGDDKDEYMAVRELASAIHEAWRDIGTASLAVLKLRALAGAS